jgi:hypothetical protein
MDPTFEINLEKETIFVDNKWYSRGELTTLLGQRLASMDYNIGVLASAVEHLDKTIKSLESFSVRLTPETAAQLRETASRAGVEVGAVIRESIISYLVGAALSKLA